VISESAMDVWLIWSAALMVGGALLTAWTSRNLLASITMAFAFNILTYVGAAAGVEQDPALGLLAFYVALGAFCVALGAAVARILFRYQSWAELDAFGNRRSESVFCSDLAFTRTWLMFVGFSLAMIIILFARGGIPLLSGSVFEAKVAAAKAGGYLNVRFMRLFLPLLFLIYLADVDRLKVQPKRVVSGLVVASLLLAFALFGYRSYVLNYLGLPVALMLGYRRVSTKAVAGLVLASAVAAFGITAVAYRETRPAALADIVWARVTSDLVSGGLGVVVYQLVPHYGHQDGRTFWMDIPAALSRVGIGTPKENSAQYLITASQGSNPYGWQAAPTLVGEAFDNFGTTGIVILTGLFGFVLEWLHIWSVRGPRDNLLFPLKIYAQHALIIAYGSPFVFSLFDTTMSLAIFSAIFGALYVVGSRPFGVVRFQSLTAISPRSLASSASH
jgi:hypothetical protein